MTLLKTREGKLMLAAIGTAFISVPLSDWSVTSMARSPLFGQAMNEAAGSSPIVIFALPVLWFVASCCYAAILWLFWCLRTNIQAMQNPQKFLAATVFSLPCILASVFLISDFFYNLQWQFWVSAFLDVVTIVTVVLGILFFFSVASKKKNARV